MTRRLALTSLLAAALAGTLGLQGGTLAASFTDFMDSPDNQITATSSFRVPAGTRTSSVWRISDAADTTAADVSDGLALAGDGRTYTTGAFGNALSASRYFGVDFTGSQPDGLAVTNPTVRLRFSGTAAGQTICYVLTTTRISTGATLQQHGDATTPICQTPSGLTDYTVAVPEVTSTTIANDLRVRIYARNSGSTGMVIDRFTFTGSAPTHNFELFESTKTDSATGSATVSPWPLSAQDDGAMLGSTSWTQNFANNRWVEYTFPPMVASNATVTSAVFRHAWRANSGGPAGATCHYYEVWGNGALLGTYNQATPTCTSSRTASVLDTITLPALTAAQANNLRVRVFGRNQSNRESQLDRAELSVGWVYYSAAAAAARATPPPLPVAFCLHR